MQQVPFLDSLVSQGLLGSGKSVLDMALLPEPLRAAVAQVHTLNLDAESELLQTSSLLCNYIQANASVVHNSFSLEEMASYQQALTQPDSSKKAATSKTKAATKAKASSVKAKTKKAQAQPAATPAAKDTLEATAAIGVTAPTSATGATDATIPPPAAANAAQISAVAAPSAAPVSYMIANSTPLVELSQSQMALIKKREVPVPLLPWGMPVSTESGGNHAQSAQQSSQAQLVQLAQVVPMTAGCMEFPQEVIELLQRASTDKTQGMLYYLLRKLSAYPMHFGPSVLPLLISLYNAKNSYIFIIGYAQRLFSQFMLKELLLKVGGVHLRYLVSVTSTNKGFGALIEELNRQDRLLSAQSQALSNSDAADTAVTADAAATAAAATISHDMLGADAGVDYVSLAASAPLKDADGILIKLRWTQPDVARELIAQKMLKASTQGKQQLLESIAINLSLSDEPFLMQLLQDSAEPQICQMVGRILGDMGSPQYSKQCLAVCSKYLKFYGTNYRGQPWQLKLAQFNYGPEFEALGIDNYIPLADKGREFSIKWLISNLLKRMTWDDLCVLAKAENSAQALDHFLLFDNSELVPGSDKHVPKAKDFYMMAILGRRIALKQDPELTQIFLTKIQGIKKDPAQSQTFHTKAKGGVMQKVTGRFVFTYQVYLRSVIIEDLITTLPEDQRLEWVAQYQESVEPHSWLTEDGANYYDLKELSSQWSQAIVENVCSNMASPPSATRISLLALYLSTDIIEWTVQSLQQLRTQIETLQNDSAAMENQKDWEDASYEIYTLKSRMKFLLELQDLLKLKRDIKDVLGSLLGQP